MDRETGNSVPLLVLQKLYSEVIPPLLHMLANPLFIQAKNALAFFGAATFMLHGFTITAPNPFKGAAFQDGAHPFLYCRQGPRSLFLNM